MQRKGCKSDLCSCMLPGLDWWLLGAVSHLPSTRSREQNPQTTNPNHELGVPDYLPEECVFVRIAHQDGGPLSRGEPPETQPSGHLQQARQISLTTAAAAAKATVPCYFLPGEPPSPKNNESQHRFAPGGVTARLPGLAMVKSPMLSEPQKRVDLPCQKAKNFWEKFGNLSAKPTTNHSKPRRNWTIRWEPNASGMMTSSPKLSPGLPSDPR